MLYIHYSFNLENIALGFGDFFFGGELQTGPGLFPCTPMAQQGPMAQYSAPVRSGFRFSVTRIALLPSTGFCFLLPPKSQPNLAGGGRDRRRGAAPALSAWAARGGAAVGSAPRRLRLRLPAAGCSGS